MKGKCQALIEMQSQAPVSLLSQNLRFNKISHVICVALKV